MHIPSYRNTREQSPFVVVPQVGSAVIPCSQRQEIFLLEVVVDSSKKSIYQLFALRAINSYRRSRCIQGRNQVSGCIPAVCTERTANGSKVGKPCFRFQVVACIEGFGVSEDAVRLPLTVF